jgi:arginine:pyruvate transaminase
VKYSPLVARIAGSGAEKWAIHGQARALAAAGRDVIELTIGEPDVPPPTALLDAAKAGIDTGRLGYSNGRGEESLLKALAQKYSERSGREIKTDQIIALPGTQTALFAVMMALLGPGDEVVVADPMYATYAGVIAATGAVIVPVALRAKVGFRLQAADVAARITPRTRVLFLNTPHNPTGAVLRAEDITDLGALAIVHDLWIVCDEVYEEMIFPGARFASPFDRSEFCERVVVTSSISKSHASPGFRSGWAVGSTEFVTRLLPLAEAMLFGNQPFIADMTALAVGAPSQVAPGMVERFARRADLVRARLDGVCGMRVPLPEAGMFAVVDVRAIDATGGFAAALLQATGVAVMPGESFGEGLRGWIRISLTQSDAKMDEACTRMIAFAKAQIGAET